MKIKKILIIIKKELLIFINSNLNEDIDQIEREYYSDNENDNNYICKHEDDVCPFYSRK